MFWLNHFIQFNVWYLGWAKNGSYMTILLNSLFWGSMYLKIVRLFASGGDTTSQNGLLGTKYLNKMGPFICQIFKQLFYSVWSKMTFYSVTKIGMMTRYRETNVWVPFIGCQTWKYHHPHPHPRTTSEKYDISMFGTLYPFGMVPPKFRTLEYHTHVIRFCVLGRGVEIPYPEWVIPHAWHAVRGTLHSKSRRQTVIQSTPINGQITDINEQITDKCNINAQITNK